MLKTFLKATILKPKMLTELSVLARKVFYTCIEMSVRKFVCKGHKKKKKKTLTEENFFFSLFFFFTTNFIKLKLNVVQLLGQCYTASKKLVCDLGLSTKSSFALK